MQLHREKKFDCCQVHEVKIHDIDAKRRLVTCLLTLRSSTPLPRAPYPCANLGSCCIMLPKTSRVVLIIPKTDRK